MSPRSFWAILIGTLPAIACGSSAVHYSGESRTPHVDPGALAASDAAPPGHHQLGEVSAECSRVDAADGLDGARSSDVACSPELLLAALRERAGRAGGAVLVNPGCEPEDAASARHLECTAEVWVPSAPAKPGPPEPWAEVAPPPAAPFNPALGAVEDFWRVEIDYWPAAGAPRRAPVRPDQVSEIDFPRVGHLRLGDVRARADADVSAGTLRRALLAGAASMGATSLVDVRCIEGDGERQCVASLAATEVVEDGAQARR
jgi:hypothetical protein